MKIALIGYGNMGQMIEKIAVDRGHTIVARVNSPLWKESEIEEAEICMEFTHPDSVIENIKKISNLKKNLVIGTTGWFDQKAFVEAMVKQQQIGALYSPNFSIGVNLMLEMLTYAGKLMNAFEEYDVAGIEYHHNRKKDSPSGTAMEIAITIKEAMSRVEKVPFSSVRCGSFPGTHQVYFDSPCDTITIGHEARSREGFAKGALYAAEWLEGRRGLFTFADCMQEIITRSTK